MSDPTGPQPQFQRPGGWSGLEGQAPPQPAPAPAPPPPAPPPPWQPPPPGHHWGPPRQPPRRGPSLWTALAIAVAVLVAGLWFIRGSDDTVDPDPIPSPTTRPASTQPAGPPPPPMERLDAVEQWLLLASDLRPDLAEPEFEIHYDGFMDSAVVIDAGTTWGVLTVASDGTGGRLHGLDAETGEVLWEADLDGTMCAGQLLDGKIACAEALEREHTLGKRWAVKLFDPSDGTVTATTEIDAWIATMSVADGRLVMLEQRLPAPHAVVTALTATLEHAWQLDLSDVEGHDDLFSDNRIIIRPETVPDGPALDRPRQRTVADHLTALWVGSRTAFIDVEGGELVAMPACSRLVDDGERIWCNDGPRAMAYDYLLNPLYPTDGGVRLAFPNRDPRDGDVTPAVFLADSGELIHVDVTTGRTIATLVDTQHGEAFGMEIPPTVGHAGGHTLVSDNSSTLGIDPTTGEVLWRRDVSTGVGQIYVRDDNLLTYGGTGDIEELDPATGHVVYVSDPEHGFEISAIGERFISHGLAELALLRFD